MEDSKAIRKYIRPETKEVVIFSLFSFLMILSVIFILVMIVSTRVNDFEDGTVLSIPVGKDMIYELSEMSVILVCVFFTLMGRIVTDSKWKVSVMPLVNMKRTMYILEIRSETEKAARELYESCSTEGPFVITENYIFAKHTGCALRKSDITDFAVTKNRRRSGPPLTGEGVRVRLTDGRWYELCGAKAGYEERSGLEKELRELLKKDPSPT